MLNNNHLTLCTFVSHGMYLLAPTNYLGAQSSLSPKMCSEVTIHCPGCGHVVQKGFRQCSKYWLFRGCERQTVEETRELPCHRCVEAEQIKKARQEMQARNEAAELAATASRTRSARQPSLLTQVSGRVRPAIVVAEASETSSHIELAQPHLDRRPTLLERISDRVEPSLSGLRRGLTRKKGRGKECDHIG
jgi:hypothetical protein